MRNNKKIPLFLLVLIVIALPFLLLAFKQAYNNRSLASLPDKIETENGVLSSAGVSKQNDSNASGGGYVLFANQTNLKYPPDTNPLSQSTPGSLARPNYLSSITEPNFGTKITRVTDPSAFDGNTKARHTYSKVAVWNRDGTKMLIGKIILDGKTYQKIKAMYSLTGEYRWSNTDPNKIFVIEGDGEFRVWDVNNATNTLLRTFPGYDEVRMGPWEGNISNDDRYVLLSGKKGADYTALVYDIATNTILGTKTFPGVWNNGIDWASISSSGKYVVINTAKCVNGTCGGTIDVYDKQMNFIRTASNQIAHGDLTTDNGIDYFVMVLGNSGRITKVNLDTGEKTTLVSNPVAHGHISCRNILRPGWCYATLMPSSGSGYQQAFGFRLDGSGTVEQFANHRSASTPYELEPQGSVSMDGTKMIWASNWLQNDLLVHDYVAEMP